MAVFLGGCMYKKRKKKKKRKIGVPCGDVVCVKYLPVRDRDDYWEVSYLNWGLLSQDMISSFNSVFRP